jgi:phosphodiesterase/alkaline phosphatase D-like protein
MKNKNTGNAALWIIIVILLLLGGYFFFVRGNGTTHVNVTQNTANGIQSQMPTVVTKDAPIISANTAVLTGEVNPNGAQTDYWYEYGKSSSLGSFTSPQLLGAGNMSFSAPGTLMGLTPSTTYYFRLMAENQNGKVNGATQSFTTLAISTTTTPTPSPSPTPTPAPITFVLPKIVTTNAGNISTTTAILNGEINPQGIATVYWYEYGKTFGLGQATPVSSIDQVKANIDVTATLSGLDMGSTYYYRLNAQNTYGTVNGNISTFNTMGGTATPTPSPTANPPTASTSDATGVTATSATLNGEVNPKGVTTSYHFEYGKSTPFGQFSLDEKTLELQAGKGTLPVKATKNISVLDENSTYYYRIVATNTYGTTYGAIFSFTTDRK